MQQVCLLTRIGMLITSHKSITNDGLHRQYRNLFSQLPRRKSVQPHPNSTASYRMMRTWISDCLEKHYSCRLPTTQGPVFSPSRLVHLQSTSCIKLSVDHLPGTAYLALSYCWGTLRIFSTTKDNLEDHMKGIAWERLPTTFQQAIEVAQNLGYEYIWIDSLCIIQHDEEDFAIQSSQMGEIYANAVVVVSADRAKSVHEGFLTERKHSAVTVRVPVSKISSFEASRSLEGAQCPQIYQPHNGPDSVYDDFETLYAWPQMPKNDIPTFYRCPDSHDSFTESPTGNRAW
jgi:hypothetical protein